MSYTCIRGVLYESYVRLLKDYTTQGTRRAAPRRGVAVARTNQTYCIHIHRQPYPSGHPESASRAASLVYTHIYHTDRQTHTHPPTHTHTYCIHTR
jgi:hypothetical protein